MISDSVAHAQMHPAFRALRARALLYEIVAACCARSANVLVGKARSRRGWFSFFTVLRVRVQVAGSIIFVHTSDRASTAVTARLMSNGRQLLAGPKRAGAYHSASSFQSGLQWDGRRQNAVPTSVGDDA